MIRQATRQRLTRRFVRSNHQFARLFSSTTPTSEATATNGSRANGRNLSQTALVALCSLSVGFAVGQSYQQPLQPERPPQVLPNGLPRTCCEDTSPEDNHTLTEAQKALPSELARIVGPENVLQGPNSSSFLQGARLGSGPALCVVTAHHLHHVVQVVQAIVDADCVVLPQGQNTGLTGGSVPRCGAVQQRPTVVLSLKHLDRIFPIDNGHRVVCLAGAGLASLEQFLDKHFPHRESHSVLGSTFLNPTTAAGVALGSGGTQCRKGPAYTERALYLTVATNKWHEKVVTVHNTLGIEGLEDDDQLPENRARKVMDSVAYKLDTWSRWIHDGYARDMRYSSSSDDGDTRNKKKQHHQLKASDDDYARRLCECNSQVSRYNADTRGPDLVRSEGKVVILATVHDTFPKPNETKTYWLSFDSLDTALAFRRQVCLDNPRDLPVSCEYMDRDSFDVVDRSGRVLGNMIKFIGTSSSLLRSLWNVKLWIEALPGANQSIDKLLHAVNNICPAILPSDIMETGKSMDHHIVMAVGDFGDGSMERLLERMETFRNEHGEKIKVHECTPRQAKSLDAFRFVAAPAFRTWCVGQGVQGFSVDYALPKNGGTAPKLPGNAHPLKRMRYSHFGCNVVHEDLAFGLDSNIEDIKYALKQTVELDCGGKLPAEHGHGTEYQAPAETQKRWRRIDPLNVMNPGVGQTSTQRQYK